MAIHCLLTQGILRVARREDHEQKKVSSRGVLRSAQCSLSLQQEYLRITSCTAAIRKLQSDQIVAQHDDSSHKDMWQLWKKQLCAEFEAHIRLKTWDGLNRLIDVRSLSTIMAAHARRRSDSAETAGVQSAAGQEDISQYSRYAFGFGSTSER